MVAERYISMVVTRAAASKPLGAVENIQKPIVKKAADPIAKVVCMYLLHNN